MTQVANPAPGFQKHPDYRVDIERVPNRLRVELAGQTIVDTEHAVCVKETAHRPVFYFPVADIRGDLLRRTDRQTFCPFKGNASYWSIEVNDQIEENAVWGYETPFDEFAALKDYVAFYVDRIDLYVDGELQTKPGPGSVSGDA